MWQQRTRMRFQQPCSVGVLMTSPNRLAAGPPRARGALPRKRCRRRARLDLDETPSEAVSRGRVVVVRTCTLNPTSRATRKRMAPRRAARDPQSQPARSRATTSATEAGTTTEAFPRQQAIDAALPALADLSSSCAQRGDTQVRFNIEPSSRRSRRPNRAPDAFVSACSARSAGRA